MKRRGAALTARVPTDWTVGRPSDWTPTGVADLVHHIIASLGEALAPRTYGTWLIQGMQFI